MEITEIPADRNTFTLDELALAIRNSISGDQMPEDQARELAYRVLTFFGHRERVVDNLLGPMDRDPFYMLEDIGILTTEMEEVTLYDGKEWRIHYWLYRKERIRELIGRKDEVVAEGIADEMVYDQLADEVWKSRKS
jgi:hypothetical protein